MATSSQSHPITTSVQYFTTDVQGRPLIPVVSDVYFPGIVNTAQLINHVGDELLTLQLPKTSEH